MNKKGDYFTLDLIFGFVIISGGVLISFRYINLGSLIASIGLVFELIKLVVEKGIR